MFRYTSISNRLFSLIAILLPVFAVIACGNDRQANRNEGSPAETRARIAGSRFNVVIVVFDAARADHFGAYGYPRDTTPNFDALAKESLLFTDVASNASHTRPSVASLLSGMPTSEHRVHRGKDVIAEDVPMLADVLARSGHRTGFFSENPLIDAATGFDRGFDTFRIFPVPNVKGLHGSERSEFDLSNSRAHVEEILTWIDADRDAPFFVYAHLLRPHNPYFPLPETAGRFTGGYGGTLHRRLRRRLPRDDVGTHAVESGSDRGQRRRRRTPRRSLRRKPRVGGSPPRGSRRRIATAR